jgi:branched-subunit amino acid ABC-type transport system permease component
MNGIHHIRRLVGVLTGLAGALAAAVAGTSAAFAATGTYPPPGPVSHGPAAPPVLTQTHAAVTGGMAGWQIALIAVGAAILGAVVAVLVERALATRRHRPATAT